MQMLAPTTNGIHLETPGGPQNPEVNQVQLSTQVVGGRGVIRVSGDVDSLAAPALDRAATQMLAEGTRSLVIDCRDIGFIASAGLQVLEKAHALAEAQGGTVTVRGPSAFTYRLMQIVGLDTVMIVEGLPEAEPNALTG